MTGRLLCRLGYHAWNLAFRRVGEDQHCARSHCDATAIAGPNGWRIIQRTGKRRGLPRHA